MQTRQTNAEQLALCAASVSAQLLELSQLQKWRVDRLENLGDTLAKLTLGYKYLARTSGDVLPVSTRPVPIKGVIFIKVGKDLGQTSGYATWFVLPKFKGMYYTNQNGKRPFPDSVIKYKRDLNGWIGIDERWYNQLKQRDLREWVEVNENNWV